jgi:hypothetical protein
MQVVRRSTVLFHLSLAVILGGAFAVIGGQVWPRGAWLGLLPIAILLFVAGRTPWRRWRLAQQSLTPQERHWLDEHVPFARHLPPERRERFERDILFFRAEQRFEAVGETDVTEGTKLAVAAGAALLLNGRPDWELNTRRTILIYPGSFDDDYYGGDYASFDGMVHAQGPVILSNQAIRESWDDPENGSNVVLHELAHLFDFDDAYAEGVPSLMDPSSAEAWKRLVQAEMRKARIGKSVLRRYAATNPAEFFAVAVENFFERPVLLHRRHAAVFDALKAFFNLDPRLPEHEDQSPKPETSDDEEIASTATPNEVEST